MLYHPFGLLRRGKDLAMSCHYMLERTSAYFWYTGLFQCIPSSSKIPEKSGLLLFFPIHIVLCLFGYLVCVSRKKEALAPVFLDWPRFSRYNGFKAENPRPQHEPERVMWRSWPGRTSIQDARNDANVLVRLCPMHPSMICSRQGHHG